MTPDDLLRLWPLLWCLARRWAWATRMEAEELFQSIVAHMLEKLSSYDPDRRSQSTWVWRVATNHCIDLQRQADVCRTVPLPSDDLLTATVVADEPEYSCEQVQAAIRQLRQPEQELIQLRYFDRREVGEIADLLGRHRDTIRKHLRRAELMIHHYLLSSTHTSGR